MSRDHVSSHARTLFVAFSLALSAPLFAGCGNSAQAPTGSGGSGGSGGASNGGSGGSGGGGGSSSGGSGGGGGSSGGSGACNVAPVDIAHDGGTASPFTLHLLAPAAHPDAVCNDGTPGSYQVRPGFGKGTKRWLIYLEGGGECATGTDCKDRYKATKGLMSSDGVIDGAIDSSEYGGIKSTSPDVNPDFYDANFVQLNYCSSDAWSGDKAGDANLLISDVGHWSFRGRKIVEAVIADLMGKGLAQADEVFLMGSSAGGVGVLNHADDLRAALPGSTRFVALEDAGFIIDYPTYDPVTMKESTAPVTDLEKVLAVAVSVWGGRGDKSCEDAAKDDAARMLCRSPSALLLGGHVESPLFVRQSQLDAVQIKKLISPGDKSAEANAYRERFAGEMRSILGKLDPVYGVFSPHDKQHGVINDTTEWNASAVGAKKLPPTIGAFYRDPCGAAAKDIEMP